MFQEEIVEENVGRLKAKLAKEKLVWVERDGTRTPIAAMSDRHLKFTIEMIQGGINQKRYWRTEYLPYLKEERHYRALINKKGLRTCRHVLKSALKT